jgi:hypothetical protein
MNEAGNKENHEGSIASVQNGRFSMAYNEKPNGATYILQLVFPPNSIRAEMRLEPANYPSVSSSLPHRFDAGRTGFDAYIKNAGQQYVSDEGELVRHLEEVTISAKRIKGIHPLSPGRMQDRIIPLEELSKRNKSAPTLYQYLMSLSDVNLRRDANGTLRARYRNGIYYYDYVFVVDGKWWPNYITPDSETGKKSESFSNRMYGQSDAPSSAPSVPGRNNQPATPPQDAPSQGAPPPTASYALGSLPSDGVQTQSELGGKVRVDNHLEQLLSLPVSRIEEIEIVKAPAPPITLKDFGNMTVNDPLLFGSKEGSNPLGYSPLFSHQGYLGTILITTKARNGGINDGKSGRSLKITPLGYQLEREFYLPAYEINIPQEDVSPDLRTTIYWNPDIRTNEDGEAEMMFYAADTDTDYTVTIEGITDDGVLIRKTGKIRRDME